MALHLKGTRIFNSTRESSFKRILEEDLKKGGGLCHKLTKPSAPPRDLTGFASVSDFINSRTGKFTGLWQRDVDLQGDLKTLLCEVYDDAKLEAADFQDLSNDDIDGCFHGIKTSRAGGSDFIKKQDVTLLPPP